MKLINTTNTDVFGFKWIDTKWKKKKQYENPVEFFPLDKAFESCDRKLRYIKHCETHVDWLMISIICLFIEHKNNKSKNKKVVWMFYGWTKDISEWLKSSSKKLVEVVVIDVLICVGKRRLKNFNFSLKKMMPLLCFHHLFLIQHDYLCYFITYEI